MTAEELTNPRPKVITICGSSRFIGHMAVMAWEMEKLGAIVHIAEHQGVADAMDELHLRKIDMSDEVFVMNVGGYIGDSTRREITYARNKGLPVKFMEPETGEVAP